MTVSRDAVGAHVVGRKALSGLCIVAALTALGACAGENVSGVAPSASAATASPAATPEPAATATTAPKAAPRILSPTEINEQCWMSSEVNKMKDLDAKAKAVDKCVAAKMKVQGM